MALSIRNKRAEAAAREVARVTGESLTTAILHSLEDRLARIRGRAQASDLTERFLDIGRRCAAPPRSRYSIRRRDPGVSAGRDGRLMAVDTSALHALLLQEPEAAAIAKAVAEDPRRLMSAFTALDTAIVVEAKKGEAGGSEFDNTDVHRVQEG
jgi:hypothetical protein